MISPLENDKTGIMKCAIKTWSITLMLLSHLLLLGQEIFINPVICHRMDSSKHLEMAIGRYQCTCDHSHQQRESRCQLPSQVAPSKKCCFDELLNIPLFERELWTTVEIIPSKKTIKVGEHDDTIPSLLCFREKEYFSGFLPRKFPCLSLFCLSVVLLIC